MAAVALPGAPVRPDGDPGGEEVDHRPMREGDTREQLVGELNAALVGQFGGRVVIERVEKLGAEHGSFVLVTAGKMRIDLGPVSRLGLRNVGNVLLDTSGVSIKQNKKGWPRIRHCIVRLAEVRDIGSFDETVAAWLPNSPAEILRCSAAK